MELFTEENLVLAYAKLSGKWVIKFHFDFDSDIQEFNKAIPFVPLEKMWGELFENGFIICDSKEETYKYFDQIVGDDNCAKSNSYRGPARVYACIYGPEGMIDENT
jgi:hypothetical protein